MTDVKGRSGLTKKQRRMIAGGAIGTMMEYYDYNLYGLAAAVIFPTVFFPEGGVAQGTLLSFATFAVGFFLRPVGGILFGIIGDRVGRKMTLMITVIGMGIATAGIGLIPPAAAIGVAAPILLVICRMLQGLFVGGEMGGAITIVVENAPPRRRGFYGAFLIAGSGLANVFAAGLMASLGIGATSWFMEWGWRIPFMLGLVLAVVAIILRRKLEESDEFKAHTATIQTSNVKRQNPLVEVFRHPKNAILGILIGLPQSIAGYVVLTFGLANMVANGVPAQVGFIGTVMVGVLQIFVGPLWGAVSDRFGRKQVYIFGAAAFAVLTFPTFALFSTGNQWFVWLGMIIGFVIPGVAMQVTLPVMLTEMFDVEARTTGVNIGYQLSNTLGGGLAPLICSALVIAAAGAYWPVIVYAAVISAIGIAATLWASLRPATEDAGRLHELTLTSLKR